MKFFATGVYENTVLFRLTIISLYKSTALLQYYRRIMEKLKIRGVLYHAMVDLSPILSTLTLNWYASVIGTTSQHRFSRAKNGENSGKRMLPCRNDTDYDKKPFLLLSPTTVWETRGLQTDGLIRTRSSNVLVKFFTILCRFTDYQTKLEDDFWSAKTRGGYFVTI